MRPTMYIKQFNNYTVKQLDAIMQINSMLNAFPQKGKTSNAIMTRALIAHEVIGCHLMIGGPCSTKTTGPIMR